MPKSLAFIISGSLAAVAIAALSVFAAEKEGGLLDRSALANLSGAPLEPTTTGSVLLRDDTGAVYRKRVAVEQIGLVLWAIILAGLSRQLLGWP